MRMWSGTQSGTGTVDDDGVPFEGTDCSTEDQTGDPGHTESRPLGWGELSACFWSGQEALWNGCSFGTLHTIPRAKSDKQGRRVRFGKSNRVDGQNGAGPVYARRGAKTLNRYWSFELAGHPSHPHADP